MNAFEEAKKLITEVGEAEPQVCKLIDENFKKVKEIERLGLLCPSTERHQLIFLLLEDMELHTQLKKAANYSYDAKFLVGFAGHPGI